ncbi:MAG TPA: bacillithiol transferase BstA [Longimicrobiaceae bacterium]|nr:bacillithiol transferase BstA [Longimicrobiaceae bacterium]
MTEDLRFPVGRFDPSARPDPAHVPRWIDEIAEAPARLRAAVEGLSDEQLDTPYRPGGWSVRQVVHHLADSHMNALARFKLALTEDEPTIKPYDEAAWAELEDTRATPPEVSLTLLDALHRRWVALLRSLGPDELARTFRHPETGRSVRLDAAVGLYAWHGRHHVAHVAGLRERMGWG